MVLCFIGKMVYYYGNNNDLNRNTISAITIMHAYFVILFQRLPTPMHILNHSPPSATKAERTASALQTASLRQKSRGRRAEAACRKGEAVSRTAVFAHGLRKCAHPPAQVRGHGHISRWPRPEGGQGRASTNPPREGATELGSTVPRGEAQGTPEGLSPSHTHTHTHTHRHKHLPPDAPTSADPIATQPCRRLPSATTSVHQSCRHAHPLGPGPSRPGPEPCLDVAREAQGHGWRWPRVGEQQPAGRRASNTAPCPGEGAQRSQWTPRPGRGPRRSESKDRRCSDTRVTPRWPTGRRPRRPSPLACLKEASPSLSGGGVGGNLKPPLSSAPSPHKPPQVSSTAFTPGEAQSPVSPDPSLSGHVLPVPACPQGIFHK